jgi:ubiquinone/menaquinone biosynthesis C-methylase UbiE
MNLQSPHPSYTCRIHFQPLVSEGAQATCPQCAEPFAIQEQIWMLDQIHRTDRSAFDLQVVSSPIPLDPEKGNAFLSAASIPQLQHANILDVGCGLGDLTYGLAQSPLISDSDIYAFDHSVESLRQAAVNGIATNGNCVHFSAQDALQLFFSDGFFDLAAGSAVLHHFLDYPEFFRELKRVMKPGATAVFSEPFFDGYFWPTLFLKNALAEHGIVVEAPGFSGAKTIIELVSFMSRNRGNNPALEHMTDKHFFRESEIFDRAREAGFNSISFSNVTLPAFYTDWMPHFLNIYGVTHPGVRQVAISQYQKAADLAGPLLPEIMSHFKYIVLRSSS